MKKNLIGASKLLLVLAVSFLFAEDHAGAQTSGRVGRKGVKPGGPEIRLTELKLSGMTVDVQGFARGYGAAIRQVSYAVTEGSGGGQEPSYTPVPASDGKYDSPNEAFSFSFTSPSRGTMLIKVLEEAGKDSRLYMELMAGTDNQLHPIVKLSEPALGFRKRNAGNFRVYYPPDMAENIPGAVLAKLLKLRLTAQATFGFGDMTVQHFLLYDPRGADAVTFESYRGVIEEEAFTFPVPAPAREEVERFNSTLDSWTPHELGDHTVRAYSPRDNNRWLSEGVGDYLQYAYLKKHYPGREMEQYLGRVRIFQDSGAGSLTVNLLDGNWGREYYLCSAAFVYETAQKHGSSVFKALFKRLNEFPKGSLTESEIREAFGKMLGGDLTGRLSAFPTDEAVKILSGK